MIAAPKTFEGTWDEVLEHAQELAGHRLRVTVLDEPTVSDTHPASDTSPEAIQAWLASFRQHLAELPNLGPWDDSRDAAYADRLDSIL